ncbi:alkaline phosphatase [Colwellia sp. 1_MG-2023]|uniref:alkaline phosphatase n=1 Tax=unclassified Colwellia TaxID=196834 RepID=UPI001C09980B|nr:MULTISPECIES: alkaline phosphatase [unclassified Colwellia]MBU2923333.1 alkaline phosphatase [Colwellia sp. C2M11]MDO6653680.1 alkaline phosphatase [Colwellia sp. 3_MG-2023]MDO6666491.1 alkaline phosphatase [Colwellia sp. 2_MG-2023]MDO6690874.1 alkaline phosphatase [Colwellia sp. 1_MG-2023]
MKKSIVIALAMMGISACSNQNVLTEEVATYSSPKNIIMVVGDGMGPAYITAYRYYRDNLNTANVEQTVFDRHLVGSSSTYPALVSGYVTDSAAGATALSAGVKSYNGAIGVDVNKKPVETVLEFAKKLGKKTGVVVTSQINHATPASYLSHNESRQNYNEIADSYYDEKLNGLFKMDVMLGGGWKYFLREDRQLVDEFKSAGFQYIDKYQQLDTIKPNQPVIGLFADVGLPWALDDVIPNRLSVMAKAAVKQLDNENGFFLLVEASQVDWGGHSNDIVAAMGEMDDLAKTLEYFEQYVKNNPDTLVVVTADHSTGGLTIGANGTYEWKPETLKIMKHSPKFIANKLTDEEVTAESTQLLFNFELTDEELTSLRMIKQHTQTESKEANDKGNPYKDKDASQVNTELYNAIKLIADQRTNTGWTTSAHTAIDVPVFAFGSHSKEFIGLNNNIDIANKIFTLLGK